MRRILLIGTDADREHHGSNCHSRNGVPEGLFAVRQEGNHSGTAFFLDRKGIEKFLPAVRIRIRERSSQSLECLIESFTHANPSFPNSFRILARMCLMRRFIENHVTPWIRARSATDSSET